MSSGVPEPAAYGALYATKAAVIAAIPIEKLVKKSQPKSILLSFPSMMSSEMRAFHRAN